MKKLASLTAIARLRVVANAQAQKITTDWDHDSNLRGGAGPEDRKTSPPDALAPVHRGAILSV